MQSATESDPHSYRTGPRGMITSYSCRIYLFQTDRTSESDKPSRNNYVSLEVWWKPFSIADLSLKVFPENVFQYLGLSSGFLNKVSPQNPRWTGKWATGEDHEQVSTLRGLTV